VSTLLAATNGLAPLLLDALASVLPAIQRATGAVLHASGELHRAAPTTVWIVVLSFVFLECAFVIGLFLPGDSLLFAAGVVLAAHDQELSAWLLALAATIAAVGGNQVGYLIGRRTGLRILARKDGRILNRTNLNRSREFFDRWGFWSIVVARWLPWIRTLAPMIAGAAGMDNRRFITANSMGAVVWVPTLLLVGYYGAWLLDEMPWVRQATTIGALAFFVLGTSYGVYRYRQEIRKPIDEDAVAAESV
jgi:membrane-associated protein